MVAHDHQATAHFQAINSSADAFLDFLEFPVHFHANRLEHAGQQTVDFTPLVREYRFHHRLHVRRQNVATVDRRRHFDQAGRKFKGTIHVGVPAERRGKVVSTYDTQPFLRRDTFAAIHA